VVIPQDRGRYRHPPRSRWVVSPRIGGWPSAQPAQWPQPNRAIAAQVFTNTWARDRRVAAPIRHRRAPNASAC
jgi:hypothetical protein